MFRHTLAGVQEGIQSLKPGTDVCSRVLIHPLPAYPVHNPKIGKYLLSIKQVKLVLWLVQRVRTQAGTNHRPTTMTNTSTNKT